MTQLGLGLQPANSSLFSAQYTMWPSHSTQEDFSSYPGSLWDKQEEKTCEHLEIYYRKHHDQQENEIQKVDSKMGSGRCVRNHKI